MNTIECSEKLKECMKRKKSIWLKTIDGELHFDGYNRECWYKMKNGSYCAIERVDFIGATTNDVRIYAGRSCISLDEHDIIEFTTALW